MQTIRCVDSHTGGEPTRTVIDGAPDLGRGSMAERAAMLSRQADWLRKAVILEPRGSDWLVGAVLQDPCDSSCAAGVIFFNNCGYLGMCGHGLIGVVATLAYLGRLATGRHRFETTVGEVSAVLHPDGSISVTNVQSYRWRKDVPLQVPEVGTVTGDIAYGGNWFFLTAVEQIEPTEIERLTLHCRRIRSALRDQQVCGADGAEIDHVELFAPSGRPNKSDSRNFVLCPGGQYDRSPCGTGTSAKLACLADDGRLQPGDRWRQESIIGSVFEARYSRSPGGIIPVISGRAFITCETTCVLDPDDPFRHGIELLA